MDFGGSSPFWGFPAHSLTRLTFEKYLFLLFVDSRVLCQRLRFEEALPFCAFALKKQDRIRQLRKALEIVVDDESELVVIFIFIGFVVDHRVGDRRREAVVYLIFGEKVGFCRIVVLFFVGLETAVDGAGSESLDGDMRGLRYG